MQTDSMLTSVRPCNRQNKLGNACKTEHNWATKAGLQWKIVVLCERKCTCREDMPPQALRKSPSSKSFSSGAEGEWSELNISMSASWNKNFKVRLLKILRTARVDIPVKLPRVCLCYQRRGWVEHTWSEYLHLGFLQLKRPNSGGMFQL